MLTRKLAVALDTLAFHVDRPSQVHLTFCFRFAPKQDLSAGNLRTCDFSRTLPCNPEQLTLSTTQTDPLLLAGIAAFHARHPLRPQPIFWSRPLHRCARAPCRGRVERRWMRHRAGCVGVEAVPVLREVRGAGVRDGHPARIGLLSDQSCSRKPDYACRMRTKESGSEEK
jgi:hypothetical protein